ncbi:Uncharacterised protein [Mycobacteroides abscessus subsp. abscessus]|nr:Uncharacterised protein [Mycobacteroides abscessus subsp. abscessus]
MILCLRSPGSSTTSAGLPSGPWCSLKVTSRSTSVRTMVA